VAARAVVHRAHGVFERTRELLSPCAVVLQQVKGHARGRLDAHARQPPQGLDQRIERMGLGHAYCKKSEENARKGR